MKRVYIHIYYEYFFVNIYICVRPKQSVGALLAFDVILLYPLSYSLDDQCSWPESDNYLAIAMLSCLFVYLLALIISGVVIAFKSRVIDMPEFNERVETGYAI